MAEIRGDDPQAQPPLHPLLPVIGAFAPSIIASQAGDPAQGVRTPAIAAAEAARGVQRLALLRETARSWDRHPLDSGGFQLFLCFCRMHSSVAGHQIGGMLENLLVMLHRFY